MAIRNELPVVLILSASDPEGGQGVQSEISALSCLGRRVFVSTIITARIERQAGRTVVHAVSSGILRSQLAAALDALKPDVVKIGFLPDASCVCEVAATLRRYRVEKVVYSPSFTVGTDEALCHAGTLKAVVCHLLPNIRLMIVGKADSLRLLRECPGMAVAETLDDVNLARCLISTFHCACYLIRPSNNNILALKNELFYYRPFRGQTAPDASEFSPAQKKRGSAMEKSSPAQKTATVRSASSSVSGEHAAAPVYNPAALVQSFAASVSGAWAFEDDVKKPLYEARVSVDAALERQSYLNADFRSAPYYPLTDGGNYE